MCVLFMLIFNLLISLIFIFATQNVSHGAFDWACIPHFAVFMVKPNEIKVAGSGVLGILFFCTMP